MSIYYLCPDINYPCGGVRKIYQHVDILNKNSIPAYVLHNMENFVCNWFAHRTPIAYEVRANLISETASKLGFLLKQGKIFFSPKKKLGFLLKQGKVFFGDKKSIVLDSNDILVVSEPSGPHIADMYKGIPKVIFNQNAYLSFTDYSFKQNDWACPYLDSDGEILATITISEDNENYLRYTFPNSVFKRLRHYSFDPNLFSFSEKKKRQICFMPRKNREHAEQVINILKFKGLLKHFAVVPIHYKTITETARILRESLIFLSFGYPEGCPLPPAEAMLAGCVVIGYHGGGGKEYFKPEFSYPVEFGNIVEYAKTVEKVIKMLETDSNSLDLKRKAASDFIKERYSPEKEEKELVEVWRDIEQIVFKNRTSGHSSLPLPH